MPDDTQAVLETHRKTPWGFIVVGLLIAGGVAYFLIPKTETIRERDGTMFAEGKVNWKKQRVGDWTFWWPNGQLKEQGRYERNTAGTSTQRGPWKQWDAKGKQVGDCVFVPTFHMSFSLQDGEHSSLSGQPNDGYWAEFDADGNVISVLAAWPKKDASGPVVTISTAPTCKRLYIPQDGSTADELIESAKRLVAKEKGGG